MNTAVHETRYTEAIHEEDADGTEATRWMVRTIGCRFYAEMVENE